MNKFISLTKTLLKSNNGMETMKKKNDKNQKKNSIWTIIGLGVLFLYVGVVFAGLSFFMTAEGYDMFSQLGQQSFVLYLGLLIVCFVVFFFALLTVPGVFFFSNDVDQLLCLPVKPTEIVSAKFIVSLVYEYLFEAIILIPMFISYGLKDGSGIAFYLMGLVAFIFMPFLPLIYAYTLNLVLMRYTTFFRNKDFFMMLSSISAIVISLGINFTIQGAMTSIAPLEFFASLMSDSNALIKVMNTIFPANTFMVEALSGNVLSLIIFIAINAAVVVLVLWLSKAFYFTVVMRMSESSSKRTKLNEKSFDKKSKGVLFTLFSKEMKILFRTPVYLLNCVLVVVMVPIIFIISMLGSGKQGIDELINMFVGFDISSFYGELLFIIVGIILFFSAMNSVTVTAISREGQGFAFSKSMPIAYRTQIMAKLLTGATISIFGVLPMLIVVLVMLKTDILFSAVAIILSLGIMLVINQIGMIIDILRPKLNWSDETHAVKNNMNLILLMLPTMALGMMVAVFGFMFGSNYMVAAIILSVLVLGLLVITYKLCLSLADKKIKNIEV